MALRQAVISQRIKLRVMRIAITTEHKRLKELDSLKKGQLTLKAIRLELLKPLMQIKMKKLITIPLLISTVEHLRTMKIV